MLIIMVSALLLGAVIYDFVSHRLPNYYLFLGLLAGVYLQFAMVGWFGLRIAGEGFLVGFFMFLPLYIFGGMSAGDVKLMAVVGSFLDGGSAAWAASYSLVAGGVMGVLYLLYKGQLGRFGSRYLAMIVVRSNIPPGIDDASRHRFPYAIAIATGTLLSLYWTPI
ncbi:A24 family peptidase [Geopseudomonas sagittaria]|uniref:A24 family peptidase n=1 Tax=Geopseudomonas sagittaria TaxID=1135990 RepID=UPI000B83B7F9|nr:prepilin peptidase [Pseudomonas sagittaria]